MAKKMSHLMLLIGVGVLLFILFFVMVTGNKEGFERPPGPECSPAKISAKGGTSNSECTFRCIANAKPPDETKKCNGGYYNAKDEICECFMKPE